MKQLLLITIFLLTAHTYCLSQISVNKDSAVVPVNALRNANATKDTLDMYKELYANSAKENDSLWQAAKHYKTAYNECEDANEGYAKLDTLNQNRMREDRKVIRKLKFTNIVLKVAVVAEAVAVLVLVVKK